MRVRTAIVAMLAAFGGLPSSVSGVPQFGRRAVEDAVEVYDVHDLVRSSRSFPMPPFNDEQVTTVPEDSRELALEELVRDLRFRLDHTGVTRAEYELSSFATATNAFNRREMLMLKAKAATQEAFKRILKALRERQPRLYDIDAHIYRMTDPQGPIPDLLQGDQFGQRDDVYFFDDDAAKMLRKELSRLGSVPRSTIVQVTTPSVTLLESQRGNILIVNKQAYVADYRLVQVLGREESIVDPVIKKLETGMGLDLRLVQLDEVFCRLEFAYQHAELRTPVDTRATRHGKIQIPVIDTIRVTLNPNIALGAWTLVTTRKQPSLGIDLILLRVRPSALSAKRARVIGAGPLDGAIKMVVVDVTNVKSPEMGQRVLLYADSSSATQKPLGRGTVSNVAQGLAVVQLASPLKRPVASPIWCAW